MHSENVITSYSIHYTKLYDTGDALRKAGNEFGSTTGRPRRCGWIDLVALKYAVMINGVTQLIMTKGDVLSDFDTIKVATGYKINGQVVTQFPYEFVITSYSIHYTKLYD